MALTALALDLLHSLQPPPAGGGGGGASPASDAPVPSGGGFGWENIGLLVLMFAVFYFLLIRPQQKRQKEHEKMLEALQKGQTVRTNGGIRGDIVDLDDKTVTLLVAEKTRINVLRSHVAGPEGDPNAAKEPGKG